ncbi:MAG TPA: proton-conducting transporter membrane subunit [Synergistaceae bacterium]|nr:proton-conducting transporter membrane subunit [Synergistaceae bacterium]HPJ25798.1 proton-conducting transporter membrane subunit [Synergistaceae bacterium]HPQ37694.1 proton-conducting transporter membrane subunit [Synergistaceae bacterium]
MNPVFAVLLPLCTAFLIPLGFIFFRRALPLLVFSGGFFSALGAGAVAFLGWGGISTVMGGWAPELGIALKVDSLSACFLLLTSLGFPLALLSSAEEFGWHSWRFYVIFFLSWASTNGILVAGDIFNLFVFFEIFSVAAYLLVSFPASSWQAVEASFKYLIFGTLGALFILLGISYIFMATGQLNMALLQDFFPALPGPTLGVIAGCLLGGLLVKCGSAPAHFWLPDAHSSARAPVSALLSGVLVKAPLYALLRLGTLFFLSPLPRFFPLLLFFGTLSLGVGHLMAMQQEKIKRMLAYSTVAQIGTILLGLGCASSLGATASIYHVFTHMSSKMGLFLVAGVFLEDRHANSLGEMKGFLRHRPFFTIAFALLAASLAGIPPLSGFQSKWLLLLACVEKGYLIPALFLLGGTLISTAYYLKVLGAFCSPAEAPLPHRRPRPLVQGAVLFLVLLSLLLAVLPLLPGGKELLFSLPPEGMLP